MIKSIGEMRTRITIREIRTGIDPEGFNIREYADIFKAPIWCKWEWERTTETFENERLRAEERAKITLRHSDRIHQRCLIWREKESEPWEVVGVNDVEDRHRWMELTLKRSVKA